MDPLSQGAEPGWEKAHHHREWRLHEGRDVCLSCFLWYPPTVSVTVINKHQTREVFDYMLIIYM